MNNNRARSLRQIRRSRSKSKRGVSPVIGVILMVAATIVIAGVVMAMLGGFKAPATTQPILQVSITPTADNEFKINHVSGDPLVSGEWQISVKKAGESPEYVTVLDNFGLGDTIVVKSETTNVSGDYTSLTIDGGDALTGGEVYEVNIMHIPSKALVVRDLRVTTL